jgi:hypothetical protein
MRCKHFNTASTSQKKKTMPFTMTNGEQNMTNKTVHWLVLERHSIQMDPTTGKW